MVSQTAPSPVDPAQKTCFGAAQWIWILDALQQSRAPFKVLLMGQVWQDKKNTETDDMYTYWYERDFLLDQVKQRRIPGVVLIGGDIHLSRHLIHRQRIRPPRFRHLPRPHLHDPHPGRLQPGPRMVGGVGRAAVPLTLTVDTRVRPAVLCALHQHDGILHTVTVPYDELIPARAPASAAICALWTFDSDGANASCSAPA
ncbi:MAG: alkaline phosphatase D family protein [Kiritimatiellia bacterium]